MKTYESFWLAGREQSRIGIFVPVLIATLLAKAEV